MIIMLADSILYLHVVMTLLRILTVITEFNCYQMNRYVDWDNIKICRSRGKNIDDINC